LFWESLPCDDRKVYYDYRNSSEKVTLSFGVSVAADMKKLSWWASGNQTLMIARMVDFYWNVGSPESEIDKLNDIGAALNPAIIGTWIDMSPMGCMNGGWLFRHTTPMNKALIVLAHAGPAAEPVKAWLSKMEIKQVIYMAGDVGTAPPNPIEIVVHLPGSTASAQMDVALEAFKIFEFPTIPKAALQTIIDWHAVKAQLRLSIVVCPKGFVQLGIRIPTPDILCVVRLCQLYGDLDALAVFEGTLDSQGPVDVEFLHLLAGHGYGQRTEGFNVIFHYSAGEEVYKYSGIREVYLK